LGSKADTAYEHWGQKPGEKTKRGKKGNQSIEKRGEDKSIAQSGRGNKANPLRERRELAIRLKREQGKKGGGGQGLEREA